MKIYCVSGTNAIFSIKPIQNQISYKKSFIYKHLLHRQVEEMQLLIKRPQDILEDRIYECPFPHIRGEAVESRALLSSEDIYN